MSDDRNASASGIILSFLLGGLTGAALAVLSAPRSGRETRELLGEKLRDGAERGREMRDRMTERGREVRDRVAAKGRETLDDAAEYLNKGKETVERKRDRLAAA